MTLAAQLQAYGRAEHHNKWELEDAIKRLNAQNGQITRVFGTEKVLWVDKVLWVATCDPQPQDCGPIETDTP